MFMMNAMTAHKELQVVLQCNTYLKNNYYCLFKLSRTL